MHVLIAYSPWIGGVLYHFSKALENNGHSVNKVVYKRQKSVLRSIKLNNLPQIGNWLEQKSWQAFNHEVVTAFKNDRPDLFFTMNQSSLLPETIREIQRGKCTTACLVADNPFDSHRYTFFPISLRYFDFLFVAEKIWIPSIKNIAPQSKIIKIVSGGGFNKNVFFPIDEKSVTSEDMQKLECDISFTGESYSLKAEGAYRAGIIDQLHKYNVKIWGDKRWHLRFPYYDHIKGMYQGERLSFDQLRKLYRLSTVNLNLPAPQIFTGFQPRLFEIAACKGFQIVDWREELDEIFDEDELVTFKHTKDLLKKVDFFLTHTEKRESYVEKLYSKVWNQYSWDSTVDEMISYIL